MENNVLIFTPKFEKDAKQNLEDFISFSEQLPPLNQNMDYNSPFWKGAVNFTKVGVSSQNKDPIHQLDQSIMPFAKAYLLYSQTLNPAKAFNEIKALRVIEKVMLRASGQADVLNITATVLDLAAQEIRESYSRQAAYHGGTHLEKLQKFLVDKKIIKPFTWLNPIKRGEDTVEKVGKKGIEHRNKKLPDENALLAIAEIFALGEESLSQRDIFTSSSIALLMAAPARGSELFYLKADCLHDGIDRYGNKALGIKWYSGKGYGYEVEWVPSAMEVTVREAVRRLQKLSANARKFASSLEKDPTLSGVVLEQKSFPNVSYKTGNNVQVKWSDGLFTLFEYQLSSHYKTNASRLWMPDINRLNEDLAPTKKKKKGKDEPVEVKSVFERHLYHSYIVTSHQIRHLLTTIAKVNGMETELLTKWAGRANEKHNRVYNHTLPEQYNEQFSLITGNNKVSKDSLPVVEIIKPETIQEINTNASLTAHQTEFGACIHDYIVSPCSKHRNCISCTEQICVKGDEVKLDRLVKRLESEQLLLESDKAAMDDGSIGADRHYNKRLETIKICSELIERLTDDSLPDGTLIKLCSDNEMSQLDKALDINNKKRLPKIEKKRESGVKTVTRPPQALAKLNILRGS
jgi:hypothetical protein